MEDCLFKKLITDAYELKQQNNQLVGLLYGAVSTIGFNDFKDVEDMKGYIDTANPDMLHLKSRATGVEIDVYKWELENYKIKHSESTIYILLKSKGEVGIMF